MFEGNLEQSTGFAGSVAKIYPIKKSGTSLVLETGLLDQIDKGSKFDILDLQTSPPRLVGIAKVEQATAEQSSLGNVVASSDEPKMIKPTVNAALRADPSRFGARLLSRSLQYALHVAPIARGGAGELAADSDLVAKSQSALDAVLAMPPDKQDVPFERAVLATDADVVPEVAAGRLWFVPAGTQLEIAGGRQPWSVSGPEVSVEAINRSLGMIGRSRNLLRVASILQQGGLTSSLAASLSAKSQTANANGSCPSHVAGSAQVRGLRSTPTPQSLRPAIIHNCDVVTVTIVNHGSSPVAITPLYVDHWSRITFLGDYFESKYGALRLAPNQASTISYTETTSQWAGRNPVGPGKIVLLATVIDDSATVAPDFRYLATGKAGSLRSDQYAEGSLERLLLSAAAGSGANRSSPTFDPKHAGALLIPFISTDGAGSDGH